jgi:hypothetical protein
MLSGRSPGVGRRQQQRAEEEDKYNLISSPTESEAGSLELYAENGNNDEGIQFVPKTTKIGALNQVGEKRGKGALIIKKIKFSLFIRKFRVGSSIVAKS